MPEVDDVAVTIDPKASWAQGGAGLRAVFAGLRAVFAGLRAVLAELRAAFAGLRAVLAGLRCLLGSGVCWAAESNKAESKPLRKHLAWQQPLGCAKPARWCAGAA
jgi:hypothetical protein